MIMINIYVFRRNLHSVEINGAEIIPQNVNFVLQLQIHLKKCNCSKMQPFGFGCKFKW